MPGGPVGGANGVVDLLPFDRRRTRGVEAPGTADWDAVCADARKTPRQGVQGVSRNPLRTPGPAPPETQQSFISRKTVAVAPLTGLSFLVPKGAYVAKYELVVPRALLP